MGPAPPPPLRYDVTRYGGGGGASGPATPITKHDKKGHRDKQTKFNIRLKYVK